MPHSKIKTMTDKEYHEWERQVEETKVNNQKLLVEFEKHLISKSLKTKTIKNHLDNIEFYANNFLVHYEVIPAEEGATQIGNYLGDYFIRKTCWASKYTIQENIASFKKFYSFLNEIGKISKDDLVEMKEIIKEEKEDWIENAPSY